MKEYYFMCQVYVLIILNKLWGMCINKDRNNSLSLCLTSQMNQGFMQCNFFLSFQGHEHIIHNGSFYYHERNNPRVIRLDLTTETFIAAKLPFLVINQSNYLYQRKDLFLDFSVDENGLWVVYGLPGPNNTAVLKMDPYSLDIEYAWNISLKHQKVGDTFIVCGVLYAVDSASDRNTNIRWVIYSFCFHDNDAFFFNLNTFPLARVFPRNFGRKNVKLNWNWTVWSLYVVGRTQFSGKVISSSNLSYFGTSNCRIVIFRPNYHKRCLCLGTMLPNYSNPSNFSQKI